MEATVQLENLTLQSLCDGAAEMMFQDELTRVVEVIEGPFKFAVSASGQVTCKIMLEISFIYDTDLKSLEAEVTSKFTMPKRKPIIGALHLASDGGLMAVHEAVQMKLGEPLTPVSDIGDSGQEDDGADGFQA